MADHFFDNIGKYMILFIILFGWAFYKVMDSCAKERVQLTRQCTQSGRPEWECKAVFQHHCTGGTNYAVPVIIPVR